MDVYWKNHIEHINILCGEKCEVFSLGLAVLSITNRLQTVSNTLLPNRYTDTKFRHLDHVP
jgi:hypothetical protein